MANNNARIEITALDRTRAAFQSVERNFAGLQQASQRVSNVLAGLGGVLSAGAFIGIVRQAVSSAAALDDMAEATGASVESLSKLTDIARIGGQDVGQIETALVRLNKALSGSDEESKGAGAAFKALGLSMSELQSLAPDKALERVAKAFADFGDGAGKTSAALAIFGKSGAQFLPLFNDIAEQSERVASLTAEQAAAAEKLEKNWNALAVSASNWARALVSDLIPALNKFFELANKKDVGFGGAIDATLGYALRKKLGVGDKNIQTEIREQNDKLWSMIESREKSLTPLFRPTETDIENQRAYVAGLKEIASIEALAGAGGAYGNEARKPQLPYIPSEDETKKRVKAVREARADMESLIRFPGLQTGPDSPAALAQEARDKARIEQARRLQELFSATPLGKELSAAQTSAFIDQMELAGKVSADVAQSMREMANGFDQVKATGKDAFAELKDAIDGWSKQATQAFVDFVFGAKASIGDLIQSIAKQFLGMQVQKHVMDPLFGALGAALSNIKLFHAGGIVGLEGGPSRAVPALAFAAAPRFHGGFLPGEYPAILQRGEGVFTPAQMRALGGPQSLRVEIRNEGTPQQVVSAVPSFDPAGMVVAVVTRDLAINGPIAQSMGALMGVRR